MLASLPTKHAAQRAIQLHSSDHGLHGTAQRSTAGAACLLAAQQRLHHVVHRGAGAVCQPQVVDVCGVAVTRLDALQRTAMQVVELWRSLWKQISTPVGQHAAELVPVR